MAAIKVGVEFDCEMEPGDERSGYDGRRLELAIQSACQRLRDGGAHLNMEARGTAACPRYHATLTVETSARNARDAAYAVDDADRKLVELRKGLRQGVLKADLYFQGRHYYGWTFRVARPQQWVVCPIPYPERLTPGVPNAPEHAVRQAINVMMEFSEDRRAAWSGLDVSVETGAEALRLAGPLNVDVLEGAKAFLVAAGRGDGRVAAPPPGARTSAQLIAVAIAAIAVATVGASFAAASVFSIAVLALVAIAIAGWAISVASRAYVFRGFEQGFQLWGRSYVAWPGMMSLVS